jgi:hypothetical protein
VNQTAKDLLILAVALSDARDRERARQTGFGPHQEDFTEDAWEQAQHYRDVENDNEKLSGVMSAELGKDRAWYEEHDPQSLVDSINEHNAGNPGCK